MNAFKGVVAVVEDTVEIDMVRVVIATPVSGIVTTGCRINLAESAGIAFILSAPTMLTHFVPKVLVHEQHQIQHAAILTTIPMTIPKINQANLFFMLFRFWFVHELDYGVNIIINEPVARKKSDRVTARQGAV